MEIEGQLNTNERRLITDTITGAAKNGRRHRVGAWLGGSVYKAYAAGWMGSAEFSSFS